tara:strand:+ start:980 stop:2032 length:1053 start_codon:yes stop_codon:yes gene_type:complete
MTEINDKRTLKEFNKITFSKYEKSKVKKELIDCIKKSKLEESCYWSAEFICAGQFIELWEIIILYVSRHIHLGNPKLPIYISLRFNDFKKILINGYIENELNMRNNIKIREIFSEIIAVLCLSRKKHAFEEIKVKKDDDYDVINIGTKLKAPNINYAKNFLKKDDPKELLISINEFAYHISDSSKNSILSCYWLEWLLEYEIICKNKKEPCICERRTYNVNEKFQKESIWLIWDIIFNETNKKNNKIINKIMESLLNIFTIKYSFGVKRKRKYIIYFAISLLTEKYDLNINILNDKEKINNITKKINVIYSQIKKNEIKPETDYLFNNISKSNLDKTIERIDTINKITNL